MKSKNTIKLPKGTTHVEIYSGEKHSRMDAETFNLQFQRDLEEMGDRAEFLRITGKGKKSTSEKLGDCLFNVSTGEVEASNATIQTDTDRVNTILTGVPSNNPAANVAFVSTGDIPDELTATKESLAWNLHGHEVESITFKVGDENNVLRRFDYIETPLQTSKGKPTGYCIAECSDNGLPVGRPYAKTYGTVFNNAFLAIGEAFGNKLDAMGVKWSIVTTGTVMTRERQFYTLKIEQADTLKLGNREFKQFLSFLNSIASTAGCTLTVTNTSFCVCCRNTFAHALHGADGSPFYFGGKHTSKLAGYVKDLPQVFDNFMHGNEVMFGHFKQFNEFGLPMAQVESLFAAFVTRDDAKGTPDDKGELSTRSANIAERLKVLFGDAKQGNDGQTALDVFSAVTDYYSHESAGESDDKTKQFESSEFGSGARAKRTMFSWLCQAMQGGEQASKFSAILKLGDKLWIDYRKKS